MQFFAFSAIVALSILAAFPAYAQEEKEIRMRAPSPDVREQSILRDLIARQELIADFPTQVGETDLNEDGVNEWIFKQENSSDCNAQASCTLLVVALKNRSPTLLLQTTGTKINILKHTNFGVHSLIVYSNPQNDLEGRELTWNPYESTFSTP